MFYFYMHTKHEVDVSAGESVVTGDGGEEEREAVDMLRRAHCAKAFTEICDLLVTSV